jgi:hypothetical protein
MSIECDIDTILKEFHSVPFYFFESSDSTENIPSYKFHYSVMLKAVRTEVQKVADICNCVKRSTHFILDGTGMLTAFIDLMGILVCVQKLRDTDS